MSPPSDTLGNSVRAAAAAGVVLVGAAGNDGTERAAYPAAFDEVLSVAACDPRLERALGTWERLRLQAARLGDLGGDADMPEELLEGIRQAGYFGHFVLFRLFDVWKPFPISRVEKWPGASGIMADDLLAGAFALAILHGSILLISQR